jgi:hypothetical protein
MLSIVNCLLLTQWVWLSWPQARTNLAGRDTELKAMRARVALQSSYIEKLEDEQSGFTGVVRTLVSGCSRDPTLDSLGVHAWGDTSGARPQRIQSVACV